VENGSQDQLITQEVPPVSTNSIEAAVAGRYQLVTGDVLKEAWASVSGNKRTIWIAIALYMAVLFVISLVLGFLGGAPPPPIEGMPQTSPMQLVQQLVTGLVATPLWVGVIFIGVAIASGRPASPKSIFSWYDLTLKLFFTYLLMGILILLGTLLFVLPGIYLAVSYQLALPLVADKKLGPWQALETSRKAVTRNWFTFFTLWLVVCVAMLASLVLLGIPLIWVLPAFVIGFGIVYRDVFDAEEETLLKTAGSK
jgi:type IV secretory pathway VirB2 component (pilin)